MLRDVIRDDTVVDKLYKRSAYSTITATMPSGTIKNQGFNSMVIAKPFFILRPFVYFFRTIKLPTEYPAPKEQITPISFFFMPEL